MFKRQRIAILIYWVGFITVAASLLLCGSPTPRGIWYGFGFAVAVLIAWTIDNVRWQKRTEATDAYRDMWHTLDEIGWNPLRVNELRALLPTCEDLDTLLKKRTGKDGILVRSIRGRLDIIEKSQMDEYYHVD
ncbi:MAG: hypothetical protein Q7S28_01100 [bacterium]|nr:hypothetical protein [bacterium]